MSQILIKRSTNWTTTIEFENFSVKKKKLEFKCDFKAFCLIKEYYISAATMIEKEN